jgi:protein-tyrosine phosphatase
MKPKIILFLCTGNYYRSRFAELLFNSNALRVQLGWQAASRGLALELGNNVGPISLHALNRLRARGVALDHARLRAPLPLAQADLIRADRVIALKREEHLPMITQRFPEWVSRIEYWQVDDLHLAAPDEALGTIEENVTTLIERLCAKGDL